MITIVQVYVKLVQEGRRTLESVPDTLKQYVEAELVALGLGTDGKPLP